MTCTGVYRGHDGVRESAAELHRYFPRGGFTYALQVVEGDVAFMVWTGHSPAAEVKDGADTFANRGGKIVAQTIHFTVDRDGGRGNPERPRPHRSLPLGSPRRSRRGVLEDLGHTVAWCLSLPSASGGRVCPPRTGVLASPTQP